LAEYDQTNGSIDEAPSNQHIWTVLHRPVEPAGIIGNLDPCFGFLGTGRKA